MSGISENGGGLATVGGSVARFYSPAAGVYPVLLPASNTAGVMVRNANVTSGGTYVFFTGTSAPTGLTDLTKPIIVEIYTGNVSDVKNKFIPAGHGIWLATAGAVGIGSIDFDILP